MPSTTGPDPRSAAVTDLADRLTVDPADVTVVSVEEVTWPDGSLGCPQPGRMYAQTMVRGHRVVLAAAGGTYAYHSGGDVPPFLCEEPPLS